MHRAIPSVVVMLACWPIVVSEATVVDFEDLQLSPPVTFDNDASPATAFVSGGAQFSNNYSANFDAWSGWAVSNQTDLSNNNPDYFYQYSAYNLPNGGGDNSETYLAASDFFPGDSSIVLPPGASPLSTRITNTNYGALSMLFGDGYARAFGQGDFFRLTITGLDTGGQLVGSPVEFYLADYRTVNSADSVDPPIVSHWTTVDLTSLAGAHTLSFALDSTDNGDFGMNTPGSFALDNLILTPEPSSLLLAVLGGLALLVFRCKVRPRGRRPWA